MGGNPRVVSSSDANGTITTTSDLLGRTTSYTDANGQTTTTTYDTLGRLSSRSGPLGTEDFVYDNGERDRKTWRFEKIAKDKYFVFLAKKTINDKSTEQIINEVSLFFDTQEII